MMYDFFEPGAIPDVMSPAQARKILGIGRGKMYQLLRSGELMSIRIGTQYRIPYCYFLDYIEEQAAKQYNSTPKGRGLYCVKKEK